MTKNIKNRILKLVKLSLVDDGLSISTCNTSITVSYFTEGCRELVFHKLISLNIKAFTEAEIIAQLDECFEYIKKIGGSENEY